MLEGDRLKEHGFMHMCTHFIIEDGDYAGDCLLSDEAGEHDEEHKPLIDFDIYWESEVDSDLKCECDAEDNREHDHKRETHVKGHRLWWASNESSIALEHQKNNRGIMARFPKLHRNCN